MRRTLTGGVLLLLLWMGIASAADAAPGGYSPAQKVTLGIAALQRWYVQESGLYRTTGWWNAANGTTVLADAMRVTGSRRYVPVLANTFGRAQIAIPKARQIGALQDMSGSPGFLNRYYDDEGWWALAWIDAYDVTGDRRYLAMGKSIFADMIGGWDSTCGGGIWWSKDRTYKNAIANELFLSVAAHLAARAGGAPERKRYEDWAAREWAWFRNSGMINGDSLVNDGLVIDKGTGACRNNGQTTWSYNQGVILGALAEWSRLERNQELLRRARQIADAAIEHLTDGAGVLRESCEPKCGADGVQFKGIFVRNLRALDAVAPNPRYRAFIETNARSIWTKDRDGENRMGVSWSGPPLEIGAGAQISALDALVADAAEEQEGHQKDRAERGY